MSVIVETSVWSLALRRKLPFDISPVVALLRDLITDDQIALLGAIRQEIDRSCPYFSDIGVKSPKPPNWTQQFTVSCLSPAGYSR